MYEFAVTVMLGLALFKVVDLVEDAAPRLTQHHTLMTVVLAIGGMFAIDWSLFERWGIGFREDWMGLVLTGLVAAGCESVWRAGFHWLGSSEGDAPEVRHPFGDRVRAA